MYFAVRGDEPECVSYQLDLRNYEDCEKCVEATLQAFGRVDILINNASALWWKDIEDTPMKKAGSSAHCLPSAVFSVA